MKKIYLLIYIALLRKKQKCFPWPNSTYSMTTFAKKIRNAIYCYFYVISSFVYIVLTFFSSLTRVSEPVAVACSSLVLFLSCTIFVDIVVFLVGFLFMFWQKHSKCLRSAKDFGCILRRSVVINKYLMVFRVWVKEIAEIPNGFPCMG